MRQSQAPMVEFELARLLHFNVQEVHHESRHSCFRHWVTPVFDNTTSILIVDLNVNGCAEYFETPVRNWSQRERAEELSGSVSIPGSDSHALRRTLAEHDVCLMRGNVDEVLEMYRDQGPARSTQIPEGVTADAG